jgi:hypothetical protein
VIKVSSWAQGRNPTGAAQARPVRAERPRRADDPAGAAMARVDLLVHALATAQDAELSARCFCASQRVAARASQRDRARACARAGSGGRARPSASGAGVDDRRSGAAGAGAAKAAEATVVQTRAVSAGEQKK